jgi:DNA adenine methylase
VPAGAAASQPVASSVTANTTSTVPPYAPVSRTASFTSYTEVRFTAGDQERLQALVVELAGRGCHVLSSNSTACEIAALYEQNAAVRQAGLRTRRVAARRAINSKGSRRGTVDEFLITNIAPREG